MPSDPLRLGIDIGTSKAAVVLLNDADALVALQSAEYQTKPAAIAGHSEQDAEELIETAVRLVRQLSADLRGRVGAIGVTNQMHGVVWADSRALAVSNLINWQDTRCETDWLQHLYDQTGYRLHSGYGAASAAWLADRGLIPIQAACLGTIGDLLVMKLTSRDKMIIDRTNAASIGFYHKQRHTWDHAAWQTAGIDPAFLPEIVPMGAVAGVLSASAAEMFGLPPAVAISAAVGDQQASLLATLQNPVQEAAVTLGTGGQISVVMPACTPDVADPADGRYEYRPNSEDRWLLTGCCLGGGAAWKWLSQTVQGWLAELSLPPLPEDRLYEYLNRAGFQAADDLIIKPHFWGERHAPELRGMIDGISPKNFNLGSISRALARGIAQQLYEVLPDFALAGRNVLVGSGNGLRRNELLRWAVTKTFGMELRMTAIAEEAAVGAALNGSRKM